jgi:O-antigen ligase
VLVVGTFCAVYMMLWISEGAHPHFQAWMVNKNWLGTQLFFMFVVVVGAAQYLREPFERVLCIGLLFVLALLLFASSARASMLAAFVFLLGYLAWPLFALRPRLLKLIFILTLTLSIVIIPLYIALSMSPVAARLDQWSLATTGQTFFSGRQIVWSIYMLLIGQAPWIGHGFAFDEIVDTALLEGLPDNYAGLSAHNQYLMIALQTGIVGLLAFGFFVSSLWNQLVRGPNAAAFRLVGPAFLAFLLHEVFEVTLIQNNLIGAWPMWMLIGFALRPSLTVNGFRENERYGAG